MAYTTIDDPSAFFQTKLYTGNGGTNAITFDGNSDLQPDWVWIKNRSLSGGYAHNIFDSVRGTNTKLVTNDNRDETSETNALNSFNSDGFTLGEDSGTEEVNRNNGVQVSWNWKAGTSFSNDASSTGIGSIDSAGSVSTAAGFSIVTFTGNSGGIAHGLAQKPAMVIIKSRNVDGSWIVTHKGLGAEMQDYYQFLDTTAAKATSNDIWGGEPTSTTFSVSSSLIDSANYVAYCFAEKQGYSQFGSYTGNGNADGTFVYTGFKPAWVMIKRTDSAKNWLILDNKRNTDDNPYNTELVANDSRAEETNIRFDSLCNGFKLRLASGASNASGGNYIYMAFAEQPFVTSTGVPATAR